MARRKAVDTENTKEKIYSVACTEFASKGFQASSLRGICQKAGYTTGALYFCYENKNDLFCKIVDSVTVPLLEFMKSHFETETTYVLNDFNVNQENDIKEFIIFLDFYYQHKDSFDVLLNNRSHPYVERFYIEAAKLFEEHYIRLINNIAKIKPREAPFDEYTVKWFSKTDLEMIVNLLQQNFSKDEAMVHAKNLVKILERGFTGLL